MHSGSHDCAARPSAEEISPHPVKITFNSKTKTKILFQKERQALSVALSGWTGIHSVDQADLEHRDPLALPTEC